MIIQCKSCSRKFVVKDSDIPKEGRAVRCGYCSVSWHQIPIFVKTNQTKQKKINKSTNKEQENLSVDSIKASDGKTYKFLGTQWAVLLPSGKTGLFAKKKIGKELDKLTGRKIETSNLIKKKKIKKELDPSSEKLNDEKQLPQIYVEKSSLGFFGYIFIFVVIGFSIVGVLKTFENDLINNFPELEYIFELLDEQLEFFSESVKNMIVIVKDLLNTY